MFEDEKWTYKEVDELSNKIAQFFLQQGYRKGDEVALLMENCPDYVSIWLGLGKIGVVTALVNTNLKTESLAHSMNSVVMKGLIFGQNFGETLEKALPYMQASKSATFYYYSRSSEKKPTLSFPYKDLNMHLENVSSYPLNEKILKSNFRDKFLYIFTSGTSGLPKAAIVTHRKFLNCAVCMHYLSNSIKPRIFYNTLPLYHIAGNVFFLGVVLVFGGKMVIRKKFSASSFWKDVVKYKVTIFFYIGEMCRYLVNQPRVKEEFEHSIQLMIGNSLKSHIWKEVQERFRIKQIIETYSSTEGNISLANIYGKVGSAGFISRIGYKISGFHLIKLHPDTGQIIRDSNGLCILCKPGETGELVGNISSNHPIKQFDGYVNTTASSTKIIRNCFKKGDMVFASGDLFVMDEDGYLFFKDRFGDTFRWKGENVSSTEVENIISKVLNFVTCIVYGVEIPGFEGRVGMAAIEMDKLDKINFKRLYEDITDRLPTYAVPAFLRICSAIEETGTYKLQKTKFREEGFNPEIIDDPLYVQDVKNKTFVPLTNEIYNDVITGKIKF